MYLALDRQRMVTFLEAPDPDALRFAMAAGPVPFGGLWPCTRVRTCLEND